MHNSKRRSSPTAATKRAISWLISAREPDEGRRKAASLPPRRKNADGATPRIAGRFAPITKTAASPAIGAAVGSRRGAIGWRASCVVAIATRSRRSSPAQRKSVAGVCDRGSLAAISCAIAMRERGTVVARSAMGVQCAPERTYAPNSVASRQSKRSSPHHPATVARRPHARRSRRRFDDVGRGLARPGARLRHGHQPDRV